MIYCLVKYFAQTWSENKTLNGHIFYKTRRKISSFLQSYECWFLLKRINFTDYHCYSFIHFIINGLVFNKISLSIFIGKSCNHGRYGVIAYLKFYLTTLFFFLSQMEIRMENFFIYFDKYFNEQARLQLHGQSLQQKHNVRNMSLLLTCKIHTLSQCFYYY